MMLMAVARARQGVAPHLTHVLLCGEHQLVVDDPVRLPLEEGGGGVDEHGLLLHQRLVPLLWAAARRESERWGGGGGGG